VRWKKLNETVERASYRQKKYFEVYMVEREKRRGG
jgi:hypothetical protein